MSFVKENEMKLIKAHVMDYKGVSKGTKELFEIADYDPNRDRYLVGNFTASDLSKTVYLSVSNVTEQTIQLKRGEILA